MSAESLQRTPLFEAHQKSGGRMVPFAGFEMPVQYTGVIAESKAVRQSAGMFDVSHMARLWLRGDRVIEFLEHVTTNDISKLTDGQGQYSLLPNAEGGVVDDIIVYRVTSTVFRMVVNASNHAKDVEWLHAQNAFGVAIEDETASTSMIAVQGPNARDILTKLSGNSSLQSSPLFGLTTIHIDNMEVFAPCSGYTGEDGFELICKNEDANQLWDVLIGAGVTPCGLGSRDVLRVEAGLPLYGHELNDTMSPLCAGLGWVISKTKSFIGSELAAQVRERGIPFKLIGIRLQSKRVASPDMEVFVDGNRVGTVSSGVYSPTLDCGIAFAFVDPSVTIGQACAIAIRGSMEPGLVVNKRFLKA